MNKRNSFLVLAGLSLVFYFAKTEKQNVVTQKNSEITIQNNSVLSVTDIALDKVEEQEKKLPTSVPIFMYHYIRDYTDATDPIGENLSVSSQKFEEQLSWLQKNNYVTVFPDFFQTPKALEKKPIILTFDDGYQDAYDSAFPLLQRYQLAGMFYLIVDKIGTPGYLSWDEILTMQKAGMAFGSHTLSHPDLRKLTSANLQKEVKESKEILEKNLGQAVTGFCYPSGKYADAVIAELKKATYQTAVTTESGVSNLKDNLFLLNRLRITEKSNIQSMLNK